MFLGEFSCLAVYYVHRCYTRKQAAEKVAPNKKFSPFIFLLPALCDMTGTSVMYMGLTMTYASSFQMLRGAVIIFTGIFAWVFFRRKVSKDQLAGMFFVLLGLVAVGMASILATDDSDSSDKPSNPIVGDILVIAAQAIVALQMCIEEKFIGKYEVPPLQVVGFEGMFGFFILSILLVPMYYLPGPHGSTPGDRLENAPDAMLQLANNDNIKAAVALNVMSIAFFNFFGVSVTKHMNATARMVLDSLRTIAVWGWAVGRGWQKPHPLEGVGYFFLILGTLLYNQIIIMPFLQKRFPKQFGYPKSDDGMQESLLVNSVSDEKEDLIT